MNDDVTLRLGAEVEAAVKSLEKVEDRLRNVVKTASSGPIILDAYGNKAESAFTKQERAADRANKQTSLTDRILGNLSGTVGKFAAGFTVAALLDRAVGSMVGFAREAVNNASVILQLSKNTGLSTDAIQRYQLAAAKSNSTTEDWTDGVFKLGVNLAGGNESVKARLDQLGLSWEALRRMSPEQQFETVTGKLREVRDVTERNLIGNELFGKGWKNIAAGVVDGHFAIANAAEVATKQQLESLNDLSDEWSGAWEAMELKATASLGMVARALKQGSELSLAGWARVFAQGGNVVETLNLMADRQAAVNARAREFGKDIELAVEPKVKSYTEQLAEAKTKLASLTDAKKAEIVAAQKLGVEEDEILRKYNISKGVLALLEDEQKKHTKAVDDANRKAAERRESLENIRLSEVKVTDAQRASILELKKREVSETDIARALGVTAAQIKQVVEADEKATKTAAAAAEERGKRAQLLNERLKEVNAQQLRIAEASAERQVALLEQIGSAEDRLQLKMAVGTDRRLLEIDQAEAAELRAIAVKYDSNSVLYGQLEGLIKTHYQQERDLVNGTADTIVVRMSQQGIQTRAELTKTRDEARRDWEQIRDSGLFTAEQVQAAWERYYDADRALRGDWVASWGNALTATAGLFQMVSQSSDGMTSRVTSGIGAAVATTAQLMQSISGIQKSASAIGANGFSASNLASLTTGVIGAVSAGISIVSSLVGAFKKEGWEKAADEIGRDFGTQIGKATSEATLKQIEKDARDLFGGHRHVATIFNLDKIIADAGGLTSKNYNTFVAKLRDVYALMEQGHLTADQARQVLDKNFTAFADHVERSGTLAVGKLQEIIALNQRMGTSSEAIQAFLEKHLTRVATNLGAVFSAATAGVDELEAGGRTLLEAYAAAEAKGLSTRDAMEAISPALDALIARNKELGRTQENAAVAELIRHRELLAANAEQVQAARTYGETLQSLAMLGALNANTLRDMGVTGMATFTQLVAAGFTERQALKEMEAGLAAALRAHRELGIPIDENTQKLIDQARAQGLLRDEGMSTNDILRDGLSALIEAVGGKLPEAWRKMREAAVAETHETERAVGGILDRARTLREMIVDDTPWKTFRDSAVAMARDVQDEVDAISFGHSPGGLKEIPLMLDRSQQRMAGWKRGFLFDIADVQRSVERFTVITPAIADSVAQQAASGGGSASGVTTDAGLGSAAPEVIVRQPITVQTGDATLGTFVMEIVNGGLQSGRILVPRDSLTARAR